MTDDAAFYFDPLCPFAWMTSKWVRIVAAERDYSVDWRFISLRMINADVDYDSHFPAGYEAGHTAGLRLLRVAARRQPNTARGGSARSMRQSEPGPSRPRRPRRPATGRPRRSPFVEPALVELDFLPRSPTRPTTTSSMRRFAAETDEALSLTGRDVGTPIIQFNPPDGVAFFGPVISRLPNKRTPSASGTTLSVSPPFPVLPS